jgi:hypothetical protein
MSQPAADPTPFTACEVEELVGRFSLSVNDASLIPHPILDSVRTGVVDSLDEVAKVGCEIGAPAASARLAGMTMLLRRSHAHERALNTLLAEIHDPSSPWYGRRFAAEHVAAVFGLPECDVQKIVSWLRSKQMESIVVSPARMAVSFAGNLRAVEAAFLTQFRCFEVSGRAYLANAYPCSVPEAFGQVIRGIYNLSFVTRAYWDGGERGI